MTHDTGLVEVVEASIQAEMDKDIGYWEHRWVGPMGIADDAPMPPSKYDATPERLARAALDAINASTTHVVADSRKSHWPMDEIAEYLQEYGIDSPRPSEVLGAYFSVLTAAKEQP